MPISIIKQVESEFDGIYRITTENGLILDVSEKTKPKIDSSIEYCLENVGTKDHVIMNGTFFDVSLTGIFVSFGGLMGNIPFLPKDKQKLNLMKDIRLSYKIIN